MRPRLVGSHEISPASGICDNNRAGRSCHHDRAGVLAIGPPPGKRSAAGDLFRRQNDTSEIAYPPDKASLDFALYRRSSFECVQVTDIRSVSGSSAKGRSGWAHKAECILPDGSTGEVALGWSRDPAAPEYTGGKVAGVIAPGGRLVADPPLAGLESLARPDPADIPNNHLAYAGQWFFFAITALVIFILAVRRRGKP
jgi:surfeit locus 1 family protein